MAVRRQRIVALVACALLVAGCQTSEQETRTALPPDTATLSPEELDRLPRYGVQRVPCDTVDAYLAETDRDTATTRAVELRLDGDSLVVAPRTALAGLGDTIRIRSDSLVWVVEFLDDSPFTGGRRTVRAGVASPQQQGSSYGGTARLVVRDDEAVCGRYYYSVAAYHPDRPGRVYLADPPTWIHY